MNLQNKNLGANWHLSGNTKGTVMTEHEADVFENALQRAMREADLGEPITEEDYADLVKEQNRLDAANAAAQLVRQQNDQYNTVSYKAPVPKTPEQSLTDALDIISRLRENHDAAIKAKLDRIKQLQDEINKHSEIVRRSKAFLDALEERPKTMSSKTHVHAVTDKGACRFCGEHVGRGVVYHEQRCSVAHGKEWTSRKAA